MGYFQYPTLYSVNCCVSDNKAAALIPGATHDRRAATERLPESADEIGSAARRGCRSGWRSSMMNEATDVRHGCRCFPLVFECSRVPATVHSLLPGSIPTLISWAKRCGGSIVLTMACRRRPVLSGVAGRADGC